MKSIYIKYYYNIVNENANKNCTKKNPICSYVLQ